MGVYCASLDRCYLRIRPARNHQHVGIRLASHYEFGGTLIDATGP